jgi:hypothetical protein
MAAVHRNSAVAPAPRRSDNPRKTLINIKNGARLQIANTDLQLMPQTVRARIRSQRLRRTSASSCSLSERLLSFPRQRCRTAAAPAEDAVYLLNMSAANLMVVPTKPKMPT